MLIFLLVGWFDGFTTSFIRYCDDDELKRSPLPGQTIVNPNAIVIKDEDHPDWAQNGSLVSFRDLRLLAPEFDKYLIDEATKLIFDHRYPHIPPHATDWEKDIQDYAELLGARFNGRWKSGKKFEVFKFSHRDYYPLTGAPLVLAPYKDDPLLGADVDRNNNFRDYPVDQHFCPFAAHTRKTGPRSDFKNSEDIEKHAIVRGGEFAAFYGDFSTVFMKVEGLHYGIEVTEEEKESKRTSDDIDRGLAFACYQSSLEDGFEHM